MRKVPVVIIAAAMLFMALLIISITASASKKDPNCINRCKTDYNNCLKETKRLKIIDRMASEDECIRTKNNCIALCPEMF